MAVNINSIIGLNNATLTTTGVSGLAGGTLGSLLGQMSGNMPSLQGIVGGVQRFVGPPDDKQADVVEKQLVQNGTIMFPTDFAEEKSWFKLALIKYTKDNVAVNSIDNVICQIGLPLPANLAEQFQMQYNSIEIGAILGNREVRAALESLVTNFGKAEKSGDTQKKFSDLVTTVKQGAVPYAARTFAKTVDPGLGAIIDQMNGAVPNPNLALMYQSHGFRSFNFSWRLAPRNEKDTAALRRLITALKYAMHPRRDGLFLTLPFQVLPEIFVGGNKSLFPMKKSAITSFNVNYAPSGIPAFFNSELPAPVEVEISLALQETEIFTQGDFQTNDIVQSPAERRAEEGRT